MTSAMALFELMNVVNKHNIQNDKFVSVIAKQLDIEGPDADPEALLVLYRLVKRIETDIDSLAVADPEKAHIRKFLAQFAGIVNLSHIGMTVQQAQSSFLKPVHINELMNLHVALNGHVVTQDLDGDVKKIASQLLELRQEVFSSELPDRTKRVLAKRLAQIHSVLEHFGVFGIDDLEEEIEALVGTVVLGKLSEGGGTDERIFDKVASFAGKLIKFAKSADGGLGTALSLAEKTAELYKLFGDTSD